MTFSAPSAALLCTLCVLRFSANDCCFRSRPQKSSSTNIAPPSPEQSSPRASPLPVCCANVKAANTAAPPLDPASTPSFAAKSFTIPNASSSVTIKTSSHTERSKFFGIKLAPMPSTLCGPGSPPPGPTLGSRPRLPQPSATFPSHKRATPVNVPAVPRPERQPHQSVHPSAQRFRVRWFRSDSQDWRDFRTARP